MAIRSVHSGFQSVCAGVQAALFYEFPNRMGQIYARPLKTAVSSATLVVSGEASGSVPSGISRFASSTEASPFLLLFLRADTAKGVV